MEGKLPPVILLMGPTAVGKTDLAMQLCDCLPCEIISVDSVMVYKGMDIGSAKPDRLTLKQYPHHLVDISDPAKPYSAANFRENAIAIMNSIAAKKRIPLLVGGTMMYFKALLQGIADMPGANPEMREKIVSDAKTRGWPALHHDLMKLDPLAASKIHPNNKQRIQRALEVCLSSDQPLSAYWGLSENKSGTDWNSAMGSELPFELISFALAPPERKTLANRISDRFMTMLEAGLVEEVEGLFKRSDLNAELPSIKAVGYRQVWQHIAGEIDRSEMILRAEAATRQLAKRQMTWLNSWTGLNWLKADDRQLAKKLLSKLQNQLH